MRPLLFRVPPRRGPASIAPATRPSRNVPRSTAASAFAPTRIGRTIARVERRRRPR